MAHQIIQYPRQPKYIDGYWEHLAHYKANWNFTRSKLEALNAELTKLFKDSNFAVAVAGSYGRMEASAESDLDFIILFSDKEPGISTKVDQIRKQIEKIVRAHKIVLPNNNGVFSKIYSIEALTSDIGHHEEDHLARLAQRMLLLMESKAIYNEKLFKDTVEGILARYLQLVIQDSRKEALFLLNDLIRYFRSIAVNYQYSFWNDNQKWVLRNVKLRHSRVLIYSGVLLLVLNASKHKYIKNKYEYIRENIFLTPMEKVVGVYVDNEDTTYERLLGAYDIFLSKINEKDVRAELQVDYEGRYSNEHYAQLKVTSDLFIAELTRFIFARQGSWTPQIFEYLIF